MSVETCQTWQGMLTCSDHEPLPSMDQYLVDVAYYGRQKITMYILPENKCYTYRNPNPMAECAFSGMATNDNIFCLS